MKLLGTALVTLLAIGAGVWAVSSLDSDDPTGDSSPSSQDGLNQGIAPEDAEARVREQILLDGQTLNSTLLVNDADALASLSSIAGREIADVVEVGDLYLVFTDIQVLYRPSVDRVVQTIAVLRNDPVEGSVADDGTGADAEPLETDEATPPDDLVEVPAPEPVPETIVPEN